MIYAGLLIYHAYQIYKNIKHKTMKPLYKAVTVSPIILNKFEIYKFNEGVKYEVFCTILAGKEKVDLIVAALNTHEPKIKGYKLIKEYPGSPTLYTTIDINFRHPDDFTDYSNYPEFWRPIYE